MRLRHGTALGIAVLAGLLTAAGGSAANADTTTPCSDALVQLHDDVVSVPISGAKSDKDRAGLVKLVDDTMSLAEIGKTRDAIVKLENLQTKVADLDSAERITGETATLLTTDAATATACLSAVDG